MPFIVSSYLLHLNDFQAQKHLTEDISYKAFITLMFCSVKD